MSHHVMYLSFNEDLNESLHLSNHVMYPNFNKIIISHHVIIPILMRIVMSHHVMYSNFNEDLNEFLHLSNHVMYPILIRSNRKMPYDH